LRLNSIERIAKITYAVILRIVVFFDNDPKPISLFLMEREITNIADADDISRTNAGIRLVN
jgi:hypothetical protein